MRACSKGGAIGDARTRGRRRHHGADRRAAAAARVPRAGARLLRRAAGTAAKFLAREDGPRIGALAFNGWDTHIDEGADSGRLATLLGALDGAIEAVRVAMGPVWSETVVTVITEFGRTARMNGTRVTDHGTGTIALLAGGAIRGGRVIADWPGLPKAHCSKAATWPQRPICARC